MSTLLLMLSLSLGAADVLAKTQLQGLSVSAPAMWKVTEDEGSRSWEEQAGDEAMRAKLELTVWTVDPRSAELCVQQVQQKLEADATPRLVDGGTGAPTVHFDKVKVAGQPAIRSVVFDYVQGAAKSEKNKVSTVTYVGCDGTTRWLMTMTAPAAKSPRYGALLKKILETVTYAGK